MYDTILRIAYRIAPEPFAERISLKISERRVERNWRDMVAKHIAAGGVVASYRSDCGTTEFFL